MVQITANNGPLCEGTSPTLTGGPDGMISYTWTGPDGFSSTEQNPVISDSATVDMSGVYALTVINSNGCVNIVNTTLVVNTTPAATLVCSDADNTFYAGASVTFIAGGGDLYEFMVDGFSVQHIPKSAHLN